VSVEDEIHQAALLICSHKSDLSGVPFGTCWELGSASFLAKARAIIKQPGVPLTEEDFVNIYLEPANKIVFCTLSELRVIARAVEQVHGITVRP
jgi:hypothetical protein